MRENINIFLSIWLGTIGSLIGIIGQIGEKMFSCMRKAGVSIVEFSFRFDDF